MSIYKANLDYFHGDTRLVGYIAYDEGDIQPKPAVLVVHDWSGRNTFACEKAELLASLGYLGFAVDMYGDSRIGQTVDEKQALMQEVIYDRRFLQARIRAAYDAVVNLKTVDSQRIAVIGFCFGGLCALDLARSGADICGAISFHGLLNRPEGIKNQLIKAKILALHGYDDPMVTPQNVNEFCEEMTQADVDWQVHMYGQTMHGFTNPEANNKAMGTVYQAHAEHRALQTMKNFLDELFI